MPEVPSLNKSLKFCLALLPALLCCVLIFCLSAQTAPESSNTSSRFIKWILTVFDPDFSESPAAEQTKNIQSLSTLTRKCAHGAIYFLLGALVMIPVAVRIRFTPYSAAFAWLFSVLYAVSDEIHQYFVAGRSCELRDICIDAAGALCGVLFVYLIHALYRRRQKTPSP